MYKLAPARVGSGCSLGPPGNILACNARSRARHEYPLKHNLPRVSLLVQATANPRHSPCRVWVATVAGLFIRVLVMRVVHCKKEKYDVYIGRPSKWGNPYQIGRDGTRKEVINKYKKYLLGRVDLLTALPELRGKILGCWCAPQPCHGDVLVELVKQMDASLICKR